MIDEIRRALSLAVRNAESRLQMAPVGSDTQALETEGRRYRWTLESIEPATVQTTEALLMAALDEYVDALDTASNENRPDYPEHRALHYRAVALRDEFREARPELDR